MTRCVPASDQIFIESYETDIESNLIRVELRAELSSPLTFHLFISSDDKMFPQRRHIWIFTILVILQTSVTITKAVDESKGVGSFTVTKLENITNNSKVPTSATTSTKTIFKPTITRTELKVARSLNHDNVQTLNVRTNNGGVATIIVKKRDGKNSVNNEPRQTYYDPSNAYSRGEIRQGYFGPVQMMNHHQHQHANEATKQQQFESGSLYRNWQHPVTLQRLGRNSYENIRFAPTEDTRSAELINSFMRHVENIENGRRERASSVDGSIPNDRASVHTNIPEPVTINSETVYVKDQQQQKVNANKRGRSLIEIDSDGIPLVNGIRVPDDENDKRQTWRNARVINGELVPYENGYIPPRTIEYGQLVYPKKATDNAEERSRKSVGPYTTADNFSNEDESNKSIGPFTVSDMFTSRSKNQNEEGIGPFSVTDNPKYSNTRLIDYIKRINDHEHRKDYFASTGRIPSPQKIQRRMLTSQENVYFPPSSKYSNSPVDTSLSGPVLQYAHPEFGLQTVSNEEIAAKNNKKIEYYTTTTTQNQQRPTPPNYYHPHQQPPMYQIEATGNAPLNTREYYNYPHKTPATYPYNYGFIRRVKPERPFWMKISEQVRDTFQSGISQVHQIAKPVMDPIMEAGEKISQNLGFSSPSQKSQVAQEKIYAPAVTSGETTFIFPALGMIAGTAALGLGAVAMGRILDMTNLNALGFRSSEELSGSTEHEHAQARALNAIHKAPTTTLFLVEDNGNTVDHTDQHDRSMKNQQQQQQLQNSNESISSSSSSLPPPNTRSSPKAKFIELIAIPEYQQQNNSNDSDDSSSSIDPSDTSEQSALTSHQRRKRNK